MTPDLGEVVTEFLAECNEILERVSNTLAAIEKGDRRSEILDALYRDMHTMKGSSQLCGFKEIGEIAHAMETCLDPVRKGQCEVNEQMADALFKCIDVITKFVRAIETGSKISDPEAEVNSVVPRLMEISAQGMGNDFEVTKDTVGAVAKTKEELSPSVETQAPQTSEPPVEKKPESSPATPSPAKSAEAAQKKESSPSSAVAPSKVDQTVRVNVELLDKLMNLVGELVLVRNQVLQYSNQTENLEFLNLSQNLDIVTSDLQGDVMKTRMQPIGNVLNKFQRVIRDISKNLGKKINLELEGAETELDKTLLEAVKDPLTHIIRNSCDHGVEGPEERKAAGKPEEGTVRIRSYHEGGQVVVEISDDGKGLDRDKIGQKAVERGIATPERVEKMADKDVYLFIFAPGFSTAQKVSSVSGRGVGMDVVKTNIERIGGTVELDSTKGKGTQIRLQIPLTLAIVPAMIVRSGNEKFAIPQVKLVELVRVDTSEEGSEKIEELQGKPVMRLRGDLLPLVRLHEIFGEKAKKEEKTSGTVNVVILKAGGEQFGLVVDEILDTADIVVKPLSQYLKNLSIFAGATIMGDGSVALILDVDGVAAKGMVQLTEAKQASQSESLLEEAAGMDAQEFLLLNVNVPGKYSIPLCLVNRLEEFPLKEVEYSGEQRVVRYRNSILPLISLNEYFGFEDKKEKQDNPSEFISVVVTKKSDRLIGLEVNSILDVVTIEGQIDDAVRDRRGILGNLVVDGEVIVVIDVLDILDHVFEKMNIRVVGEKAVEKEKEEINQKKNVRILYAEDAPFFRRQVKKILTSAGYDVETQNDGQAAFHRLQNSNPGEFQLVLSDIEMPKMTGFQLATEVRKIDNFKLIPMIAVTTRYSNKDIEDGKSAGFNLYMEKLNAEKLIHGIEALLSKPTQESTK